MKFLRFLFILCLFNLFTIVQINAQVDPEDPPDDGGGTELGVPLSGQDIFFLVALALGGVVIYAQKKNSKAADKG
jgi:hypothetical protein